MPSLGDRADAAEAARQAEIDARPSVEEELETSLTEQVYTFAKQLEFEAHGLEFHFSPYHQGQYDEGTWNASGDMNFVLDDVPMVARANYVYYPRQGVTGAKFYVV